MVINVAVHEPVSWVVDGHVEGPHGGRQELEDVNAVTVRKKSLGVPVDWEGEKKKEEENEEKKRRRRRKEKEKENQHAVGNLPGGV